MGRADTNRRPACGTILHLPALELPIWLLEFWVMVKERSLT